MLLYGSASENFWYAKVDQDLVPSSRDVLSPQGLKWPVGKMSSWVFVHGSVKKVNDGRDIQ
jgi:hypothetical protein